MWVCSPRCTVASRRTLPERVTSEVTIVAALTIALPVLPGKIEQARRWGQEKMGPRRSELAESNRRFGATRESWHLQ